MTGYILGMRGSIFDRGGDCGSVSEFLQRGLLPVGNFMAALAGDSAWHLSLCMWFGQ